MEEGNEGENIAVERKDPAEEGQERDGQRRWIGREAEQQSSRAWDQSMD